MLSETLPEFTRSNFKCSTMLRRVAHSQSVVRSPLRTPFALWELSCSLHNSDGCESWVIRQIVVSSNALFATHTHTKWSHDWSVVWLLVQITFVSLWLDPLRKETHGATSRSTTTTGGPTVWRTQSMSCPAYSWMCWNCAPQGVLLTPTVTQLRLSCADQQMTDEDTTTAYVTWSNLFDQAWYRHYQRNTFINQPCWWNTSNQNSN